MFYNYDEEGRWRICVHEAAHAVIAALGGAWVYEIAVAPLGCDTWAGDYCKYDIKWFQGKSLDQIQCIGGYPRFKTFAEIARSR